MSVLSDDLYLDNIEEYVQDENRIVTYKWISRTFNVPVIAAKRMLYAYIQRCKSSDTKVSALYIITGESLTDNSILVQLVSNDELENCKSQYSTVWSIHVYSVQKTIPKDSSILYNSDYKCIQDHLANYSHWNTIVCPDADKLRTGQRNYYKEAKETTGKAPIMKLQPPTQMKKKPAGPMNSFFNEASQSKPHKKPSSVESKPKNDSTKKAVKEKEKEKENDTVMERDQESYFQTDKEKSDSTKDTNSINEVEAKKPQMTEELVEDPMNDPVGKVMSKKSVPSKQKRSKDSKTSLSLSKKKRKRIQDLSSDESDSDPVEQSNEEQNEKVTTAAAASKASPNIKKRKRTKKLVDKMFIDEDGSMITEKRWEYVSTDASSEEEDKPSIITSSPTSKSVSPNKNKKTKQSSLMNFFTK